MKKLWKGSGLMSNVTCLGSGANLETAISKREAGLLKTPRYPFFRISQFFNGSLVSRDVFNDR